MKVAFVALFGLIACATAVDVSVGTLISPDPNPPSTYFCNPFDLDAYEALGAQCKSAKASCGGDRDCLWKIGAINTAQKGVCNHVRCENCYQRAETNRDLFKCGESMNCWDYKEMGIRSGGDKCSNDYECNSWFCYQGKCSSRFNYHRNVPSEYSGLCSDIEAELQEEIEHAGKDHTGYFKIIKGTDDQFYFSLYGKNHEIVLSSEGYKSKQGCKNGIDSVVNNSVDSDKFDEGEATEGTQKFYFVLKAKNGETIGRSEMYKTAGGRSRGIRAVQRIASNAEIKDEA